MAIFYKDQRLSHMSKGDAYLWSKFLDKYPDMFKNIQYDVRVGKSVFLPKEYPEWLIKSARDLSRKRIDVVAQMKNFICVIEVRVHAKANVIGELINYKHLYEITFRPNQPILPILVTDTVEADLLITLKELSIPFFIV